MIDAFQSKWRTWRLLHAAQVPTPDQLHSQSLLGGNGRHLSGDRSNAADDSGWPTPAARCSQFPESDPKPPVANGR
jgi:hypothetical protein